jgi:hypothetical protein
MEISATASQHIKDSIDIIINNPITWTDRLLKKIIEDKNGNSSNYNND